MKKYMLFVALFYLAACAGNPPSWWNPTNRYTGTASPAPVSTPKNTVQPIVQPVSHVEEASFETDTEFEEMALTEETDEQQAALAAQEMLSPSLLQ